MTNELLPFGRPAKVSAVRVEDMDLYFNPATNTVSSCKSSDVNMPAVWYLEIAAMAERVNVTNRSEIWEILIHREAR